MSNHTLYIIGNGFDRNHGMPTGYGHFKAYVRANDRDVHDWIEDYVPAGDDWAHLEAALADLDTDHIVTSLGHFMGSYGDDDWSDSGHHDFQYEVNRVAEGLSGTLQTLFAQWIRTIEVPGAANAPNRLADLDLTATYLTFNYTSTLTSVYQVPRTNILHIHGESSDEDCELVLGHGWAPEQRPSLFEAVDHEDSDHRIIEAMTSLDDFFTATFKPSHAIIVRHGDFFARLGSVQEIVVLGHSLDAVDGPYFKALVRALDNRRIPWTVAVLPDEDEREKVSRLQMQGVDPALVRCKPWSEFHA